MFKILTICIIGFSLVNSLLSQSTDTPPAPLWGKCGGMNWSGPTTCPENAYCKFSDDWYSQCVPDDRPTTTTGAQTTSSILSTLTTTGKPVTFTTTPLTTTFKPITTTARPITTTTTIRPITTTTTARPITTTTTIRPITTTTSTRPATTTTTTTTVATKPITTTTAPTTTPLTTTANALITEEEFMNAVTSNGYPRPTSAQYKSYSSQLQSAGGITTKREAAMFLAQVMHESGGLQFKSELICATDGCPNHYEITPGIGIPGKRYFGRGYIQLTWDYNYKAASKDLYNDDRLIQNPEQVATDEQVSWATAFWFWKANVGTDSQVKAGYFGASTNRINGALECRGANLDKARKRFDYYKKVLIAFHVTETPIENGCYN